MSTLNAALATLVLLLDSAEDRDRVSAADKLLRSESIDKDDAEKAIATLTEVMNDEFAKAGDRVNAADKLKGYSVKTRTEMSTARKLAALTDEELDGVIVGAELPRLGGHSVDPLLD